jgi:predicted dehydrogenase
VAGGPYKVVVVGLGKRGKNHAQHFARNPRFVLAGLSTRDPAKLEAAARELGNPPTDTDPARLAKRVRPDVFCFCTPPTARLELVRLGVEAGARLIACEKPIALSMNEAIRIRAAARGVRTVVSHQHRYGPHYRKVKELVASGALGRVHTVYATCSGWMFHLLTHMIDYMRWFAGEPAARWVMAQAAGRGKLADNHPSPDYLAGVIQFDGGLRGFVDCGAGANDVPEAEAWWRKNRIGAKGPDGFAEVLTGGGWRAVTRAGASDGPGNMNYDADMPPYIDQMADWLDDERKVHPCNGESAYAGFEIVMAMLRSVVERGQVALPWGEGEPELEALARVLPARPVLVGFEGNRKEYGV